MVFQYYPESDMLYIQLAERTSAESEEVAPGVVVDFDEHNKIVGVEIENASTLIDLTRLELNSLPLANVIFGDRIATEK